MTQSIEKHSVLFADICGSTSLYDNLGDDIARRLISETLNVMTAEIAPYKGTLIKTIGDEILCIFPTAEAGCQAACAMQNAVKGMPPNEYKTMHIRIGFHYGLVICEDNDVYGDIVNVAARVAAYAKADQIITTAAVYEELPPTLKSTAHQVMAAELKGKQEQCDIYLVIWEEDTEEHTRISTPTTRRIPENNDELHLKYGDLMLTVNRTRNNVVAGRGDNCDIIVKTQFASRQHARFEQRFGKFIVSDQSTNGTYIQFNDGRVIRVSREEIILQGAGLLSLGQAKFDCPEEIIEFAIMPVAVAAAAPAPAPAH